jgi:tRNA pseudouridine synthase A 2
VHARGMCCNVFLDTNLTEEEIQEYCNHYLPEDIGINSVKKASERFHARYLARGKVYRYSCYIGKNKDVFERKYLYHLEEEPDIEEMKRAGAYLVGEKDFKSFSGNPKMKKSTVRKIFNIDILRNGNILRFYFHGSGFLQYQIRIMVGTLLEVGYHKKRAEEMEEILLSKDRRRAGYTAPAKGLCLMKVEYD